MLVEERSVGRGGGEAEEGEEEVDDENPRSVAGTDPAAAAAEEPEGHDRSTSLGAPLEISHSEASPPAAHQTRGPEGGDKDDDDDDEEEEEEDALLLAAPPPMSLSHGAAATASASTLGAPGSLRADTRISSLASHRDRTPREEPVRIQEEPTGSATIARMEPSQAGAVSTQAS